MFNVYLFLEYSFSILVMFFGYCASYEQGRKQGEDIGLDKGHQQLQDTNKERKSYRYYRIQRFLYYQLFGSYCQSYQ